MSDLAGQFTVSRPAISQHLKVLHDANLVSVRSEGTRRYYRARPEGLTDLKEWLDQFWTTSLQRLAHEVELDQRNTSQEHQ